MRPCANSSLQKFQALVISRLLSNERNSVADGLDFIGNVFRNLEVEFFLKIHDQFDNVQRVSAQVVNKRRIVSNFFNVNAKVFGNEFKNLFFDILFRHDLSSKLKKPVL